MESNLESSTVLPQRSSLRKSQSSHAILAGRASSEETETTQDKDLDLTVLKSVDDSEISYSPSSSNKPVSLKVAAYALDLSQTPDFFRGFKCFLTSVSISDVAFRSAVALLPKEFAEMLEGCAQGMAENFSSVHASPLSLEELEEAKVLAVKIDRFIDVVKEHNPEFKQKMDLLNLMQGLHSVKKIIDDARMLFDACTIQEELLKKVFDFVGDLVKGWVSNVRQDFVGFVVGENINEANKNLHEALNKEYDPNKSILSRDVNGVYEFINNLCKAVGYVLNPAKGVFDIANLLVGPLLDYGSHRASRAVRGTLDANEQGFRAESGAQVKFDDLKPSNLATVLLSLGMFKGGHILGARDGRNRETDDKKYAQAHVALRSFVTLVDYLPVELLDRQLGMKDRIVAAKKALKEAQELLDEVEEVTLPEAQRGIAAAQAKIQKAKEDLPLDVVLEAAQDVQQKVEKYKQATKKAHAITDSVEGTISKLSEDIDADLQYCSEVQKQATLQTRDAIRGIIEVDQQAESLAQERKEKQESLDILETRLNEALEALEKLSVEEDQNGNVKIDIDGEEHDPSSIFQKIDEVESLATGIQETVEEIDKDQKHAEAKISEIDSKVLQVTQKSLQIDLTVTDVREISSQVESKITTCEDMASQVKDAEGELEKDPVLQALKDDVKDISDAAEELDEANTKVKQRKEQVQEKEVKVKKAIRKVGEVVSQLDRAAEIVTTQLSNARYRTCQLVVSNEHIAKKVRANHEKIEQLRTKLAQLKKIAKGVERFNNKPSTTSTRKKDFKRTRSVGI